MISQLTFGANECVTLAQVLITHGLSCNLRTLQTLRYHMSSHSWETTHAWERGGDGQAVGGQPYQPWDDDEAWGVCSDSEVETPPLSPAQELLAFLISLLHGGFLSARQFCVICYWAGKCGIVLLAEYGLHPNAHSGKYKAKTDRVTGARRDIEKLYSFEVPGHNKHDLERTVQTCWMRPAHEPIDPQVKDPVFRHNLSAARANKDLPNCYYDHPVVKASGDDPVAPFGIFTDALPYSLTDSAIGWWLINLVTKTAHLDGRQSETARM